MGSWRGWGWRPTRQRRQDSSVPAKSYRAKTRKGESAKGMERAVDLVRPRRPIPAGFRAFARKELLIHAALAPGGLFMNVEHVASPTQQVEALFDTLYIDHMAAHLQRPRE